MYKKKMEMIFPIIIVYIFLLLFFLQIEVHAIETNTKYVLIYQNLYEYGKEASSILELYIRLKSNDLDVRLLQIDRLNENTIPKDAQIIALPSSFDSKEKYSNTIDYLRALDLKVYNNKNFFLNETIFSKGLLIGIDEVYPFSDLNRLMDISEELNDLGIEYICTIMPVYENYELDAYDKFIEVIKYVHEKGGQIFIHYPVTNEDGTYDTGSIIGLKKAIEEYRRRGLEIDGMTLSLNNFLNNSKSIQDLNVQFLLVTESKTKVDTKLDMYKISKEIDKYTLINGLDITSFNIFSYIEADEHSKRDLVYITVDEDMKKYNELLEYFRNGEILINDFKVEAYSDKLNKTDDTGDKEESSISNNNITQLDKFKEEQLRKIRGENLDKDQKNIQGYDLSKIVNIGLKAAFVIILVLIMQVFIGRRYDYRKNFRK